MPLMTRYGQEILVIDKRKFSLRQGYWNHVSLVFSSSFNPDRISDTSTFVVEYARIRSSPNFLSPSLPTMNSLKTSYSLWATKKWHPAQRVTPLSMFQRVPRCLLEKTWWEWIPCLGHPGYWHFPPSRILTRRDHITSAALISLARLVDLRFDDFRFFRVISEFLDSLASSPMAPSCRTFYWNMYTICRPNPINPRSASPTGRWERPLWYYVPDIRQEPSLIRTHKSCLLTPPWFFAAFSLCLFLLLSA